MTISSIVVYLSCLDVIEVFYSKFRCKKGSWVYFAKMRMIGLLCKDGYDGFTLQRWENNVSLELGLMFVPKLLEASGYSGLV